MTIKTTANVEIKKFNRTNIYMLLRKSPDLSRQDIVIRLKLSLPTVIQNITEMCNEGLIKESGVAKNTGGRRAALYSIVPDAKTAIGLDITEHHVTAVAVDLMGNIIYKKRIKHSFSRSEEYNAFLGETVNNVISEANIDPENMLGVGFGVPALISKEKDEIVYGKILNFTGATCDEFSSNIPFKTILVNDANAACFAESWVSDNIKNSFYIMLSNNVGGAVLVNGSVYSGDDFRSGEIGHLTLVENGKQCYCGKKGCVDQYLSALVLSEIPGMTLEEFFQNLKNGDEQAKAIWADYLKYLAKTINSVRILFDCAIIIGGYVGGYVEPYLQQLKDITKSDNPFDDNADFIKICKFKNEAIAAGAALDFISEYVNSI